MEQSEIVKGNAEVLYATAYELTIMLPNLALALLDVIHIYPIILLPAVAPIQQFQLLRNFDAHACFIRQAKSNPKQFLAHRGIGSIVQNSKLCNVDTNKENGKMHQLSKLANNFKSTLANKRHDEIKRSTRESVG